MINNVTYDLVLLKDGQEIMRKDGQTTGAIGSEQYTFRESQQGSVTMRLENLNDTGESVDFNIQVVPEFPLSVLMVMGVMVTAMLAVMRFRSIRSMQH
jgi:hypothetical protein